MDILGQSALILAVTALALALTALSRNLRNKLTLSYAALSGVVFVWAMSFFLEKIFESGAFYNLHLAFNLILAPVALAFIRVLTRVETRFTRWLFNASVAFAVGVIALQWSSFGSSRVVVALADLAPVWIAADCIYLMLIDWELKLGKIRRFKISTVGLTRRTWVYGGALVLLGVAVMDHAPFMGDVIPSFGNIFLGLYLFMINEAIVQQRLLNVSAMINRMAAVGLVCAMLSLIYLGLTGWVENSPDLFTMNAALASFIIVVLIDPLRKVANYIVVRVISPRYLNLEQKVEQAQIALTGILDTGGLAQLSLNFLDSALGFESATVFVLQSDGSRFRRIRGLRDELLSNREILVNHPVVEHFLKMRKRGETPVILDMHLENEIDRTTSQNQRQAYDLVLKGLHALNGNIAIPFMDHGSSPTEVFGFVALRAPNPPEPWGNNWGLLSVIYPFFMQAARTLKNMEIYVRLREKERLAALGEMAAGLAHEIRNPLGAIKGATQYLESSSSELSSEASPFLRVIVEEVNRLNKVVTEFLDYSRPYSAESVSVDLGHVIERTHALFQSLVQKSPVQIDLVQPKGGFHALPKVQGSPEQIKQVLVNLVQNSLQALERDPPEGGGRIQISARIEARGRARGGDQVVIYVEDNGKGIPREEQEKIFIPFYTTNPQGTGLGLAICARIVESHGGRISVQSDEGKFTRFTVYMPAPRRDAL